LVLRCLKIIRVYFLFPLGVRGIYFIRIIRGGGYSSLNVRGGRELENVNILFLSSNGHATSEMKEKLEKANIRINEVGSFEIALKELQSNAYHAFIQRCINLEEEQGKLVRGIKELHPHLPVIIVGKDGSIKSVVRLMKAGANDVAVLPTLNSSFVKLVLKNVKKTSADSQAPRTQEQENWNVELIGQSRAIEEVRSAIDLVANSHTAVLITGESGTGKEVVARMIHMKSGRLQQPFVAINCAAIPKEIMENELFGHVTGAFTGAVKKKIGCFEAANGGTLFFDEIAEMNPDTQAKLLRVLEQKSFRRLGGEEEIHVDVRTIAATNKKIRSALKSGEFREDLYYRFSVIEIPLPPLRERKEDIRPLVEHFLTIFKQKYNRPDRYFREDTMQRLMEYDWPGNIRELRNVVERTVVITAKNMITPEGLPPAVVKKEMNSAAVSIPLGTSLDEAEQMLIRRTLAHLRNNKSLTAKTLGLGRKTLYSKLKKFSEEKVSSTND